MKDIGSKNINFLMRFADAKCLAEQMDNETNSILNNPYRVIGILANASTREVESRKAKISAFTRVGREIPSEYDFSFLNPIQRTKESIDIAFSKIEQNHHKVSHSLFWFIDHSPIDNTAIQHLVNGDTEKASEIWGKLTVEKEVNSKNFSAFNNIGTLNLLGSTRLKIKQGITAKVKLIESDYFKNFIQSVADKNFSIEANKQIETLIDQLLKLYKIKYSIAETMYLFSNCNDTIQKYICKKLTEEPIYKIETQIEQCTKKRTNNRGNAYKFGTDLHNNTKSELTLLKSILGTSNLQYKMLADNIAKELLQCSVNYFNENQEQEKSSNYLEEAIKLTKLAESIAVNVATKNKAKQSISTLEDMKDRELSEAIAVLKSIKDAYEKAYDELLRMVQKKLGIDAHGIFSPHDPSINYSKIIEAARDSINKKAVIELSNRVLTTKAIIKIAQSKDEGKIKEFYELLKYVNNKIVNLDLNEKEEILYNVLPQSNSLYKLITERKEQERIFETERKEQERIFEVEKERKRKIMFEFEERKKRAEIEREAKEKKENYIAYSFILIGVVLGYINSSDKIGGIIGGGIIGFFGGLLIVYLFGGIIIRLFWGRES